VRTERLEGPTPSGGAYADVHYDDADRVVEIHEYDEAGNSILREFKVTLHESVATVEMREHHALVESARAAVEQVLKAWEISHALRSGGRREFRFEFDHAHVVERNPGLERPPGKRTVSASVAIGGVATVESALGIRVKRGGYPQPPTGFAWTPDVETLWIRWQGYLAGREPLPAMAYACLTLLERRHGGRSGAAAHYGIAGNVLATVGRLSSEVGDERTARKLGPKLRPLTGEERAWLEETVKALIRRVGEVAATGSAAAFPPLTLADLPDL